MASKEDYQAVEKSVEDYLIKNDIVFKKQEQILSKFRPDFLLDKDVMIECKFVDDSNNRDPTWERNLISQATLVSQLLRNVYYDRGFRQILVIKRKSGRCSPTNFLYGNILFDIYLPFEHLEKLASYLKGGVSKEELFFSMLDETFYKHWKKTKAGQFPTGIYHFLLCIEKGECNNVTDFIKNEDYAPSTQATIYNYLRLLSKLGIVSVCKSGRYNYVKTTSKKWRYLVYLDIFSKGRFTIVNIDYAKKLWSRISHLFNICESI